MKVADDDRLRAFWDARYRDFTLSESGWMGAGERLNARIYACKIQALTRSLAALNRGPRDPFAVLDAGCGQGYFARFYRAERPLASYVGIDISERAVAHLRGAIADADLHVADLSTWTHPAGRRFDVIQCLEVLHLILDDDMFARAVRNLSGQLAAGGSLLVTAALPPDTLQPNGYLRYRSRRLWSDTLSPIGLRIVDERPMYYWLPAGGPANKYARYALTRLGADALYVLDRAALALRIPQPASLGVDCRTRLLTIQRVGA